MITRSYFVRFKTSNNAQEGDAIITWRTWFSCPLDMHQYAREVIGKKIGNNAFTFTSITRIK